MAKKNELLTVADVMRKLKISRATLYRYMATGGFPLPCHIGGSDSGGLRWLEEDIDKHVEESRV